MVDVEETATTFVENALLKARVESSLDGMVVEIEARVAENGASIEVEVWALPSTRVGAFLASVAAPLGIGSIELLEGRPDFLDEIGNAHIVLGRALLEQGRLDEAERAFAEAELNLSQLSSASHRAVAWTAQGDLASRRGDDSAAAALYRRAAEALQDVRF